MEIFIGCAAVFSLFVLWIIKAWDRFSRLRDVSEVGWNGIELQLGRRLKIVPEIADAVEAASDEAAAAARGARDACERVLFSDTRIARMQAEDGLTDAIGAMMAIADSSPQLLADEGIAKMEVALSDIYQELRKAIALYDIAAERLNMTLRSFPNVLAASMLRFKDAPVIGRASEDQ